EDGRVTSLALSGSAKQIDRARCTTGKDLDRELELLGHAGFVIDQIRVVSGEGYGRPAAIGRILEGTELANARHPSVLEVAGIVSASLGGCEATKSRSRIDIHGASPVIRGQGLSVGNICAEDFSVDRNFVAQRESCAGAFCQVQVAIGVHAAAKVEVGARV